ncbi:hypothetical protein V512_004750 [Mesotoga sp. Brook.08.105.5.1]|nr:hypothetical protein RJ60_06020 [Mesotoga sp. B105.6.4]PVD16243.1 hypothetical protein V512_004750 [Mesotoga sp. Brook.08.105.5.1]
MVMTFFVAELAALFFVLGKERERKERGENDEKYEILCKGKSEVRGMRLEVRRSRSLRSSDLLPLTSSSSQPKDGSMIWDESRRTVLHSDQRVHRS